MSHPFYDTAYTPRPWQVLDDGNGEDCSPPEPGKRWLTIADADGEELAVLVNRKGEPTPRQHADARLMALAPELYERLRAFEALVAAPFDRQAKKDEAVREERSRVRALLAKVVGLEPVS